MSVIVWLFEYSLALPFSGIGMKTDLFPGQKAHNKLNYIMGSVNVGEKEGMCIKKKKFSLLEIQNFRMFTDNHKCIYLLIQYYQ